MAYTDIDDFEAKFIAHDWIGVGRNYDLRTIPFSVILEKGRQTAIPDYFLHEAHLPAPNTSVKKFVAWILPRVSSEIISTKVQLWFSKRSPSNNLNLKDTLLSRPIPPYDFVEQLDNAVGQQWLDGAKSITDQRFNDGMEALPLWAIMFWKEVHKLNGMQSTWRQSLTWLEDQAKKYVAGTLTTSSDAEEICALLTSLKWDTSLKYCREATTTYQLTRFLGTRWLSDDNINMMVEELQDELAGCLDVNVADLNFTTALQDVKARLALPLEKRKKTLLGQYEPHIKNGTLQRLYFPLYVNKNHWVAVEIDFKKQTFSFGNLCLRFLKVQSSQILSLGNSLEEVGQGIGVPTKYIKSLQIWFKSLYGKSFKNRGNSLAHAVQNDSFSCGVITMNTIAHAIFQQPLWTPNDALEHRLKWFKRLASGAVESLNEHMEHITFHVNQSNNTPSPIFQSRVHPTIRNLLNYESDSSSFDSHSDVEEEQQRLIVSEANNAPLATKCTVHLSDSQEETDIQDNYKLISKRKRSNSPSQEFEYDGESVESDSAESQRASKFVKAGEGTSRSAVASRERRKKLFDGTFKMKESSYEKWKAKISATDKDAEFNENNIRRARHSLCGKFVTMKDPFDLARWKDHLKICNQKHEGKMNQKSPSLFQMGWLTKQKKAKGGNGEETVMEVKEESDDKNRPKRDTVPCPGITPSNDPRVKRYLKRTGTLGGGGRAIQVIAKELFGKLFSQLKNATNRQQAVDQQINEWKWRNDHANTRVFSFSCKKVVLDRSPKPPSPCSGCQAVFQTRAFKTVINKPIPSDKNSVFVNYRFRNHALAKIYGRITGVRELIESEVCIFLWIQYITH